MSETCTIVSTGMGRCCYTDLLLSVTMLGRPHYTVQLQQVPQQLLYVSHNNHLYSQHTTVSAMSIAKANIVFVGV